MAGHKDRHLRDAIEAELAYYPEVSWSFDTSKSHPRYVLCWRGQVFFHVVPSSTGDSRSWLAQLTHLKRQMRQRGVPRIDDPEAYRREMRRRRLEEQRREEAANVTYLIQPEETPVTPPPLPPEDPQELLRRLQRNSTMDVLVKWHGKRANEARIVEAAMLLIGGWHPDIVLKAADLILDAEQPLRDAQDRQQRKVQR